MGQLLEDLPEQLEFGQQQQQQQQLGTSAPTTAVVVKGKRGRKPGVKSLKTDMKSKLERSRQSARECRYVQCMVGIVLYQFYSRFVSVAEN